WELLIWLQAWVILLMVGPVTDASFCMVITVSVRQWGARLLASARWRWCNVRCCAAWPWAWPEYTLPNGPSLPLRLPVCRCASRSVRAAAYGSGSPLLHDHPMGISC